MARPERTTGLTYSELVRMLPEDNRRIELIDGELVMAPSPTLRHQRVVLKLGSQILAYAEATGGQAYASSVDTYVSETNVLQPDAMYRAPGDIDPGEVRVVHRATLVVEVSSPSTRRRDLGRKKELYADLGVPEYWFVDLDAERIEIYRLRDDGYGPPAAFAAPGGHLTSPNLPGFSVDVGELLRA